jgi:hypothetical protein
MKKRKHELKTWLLWLGAPLLALLVGYFYLGPNLDPEALELGSKSGEAPKQPLLSFEAGPAETGDRGETEVEILTDSSD